MILCINDFEIAFGADVHSACPPQMCYFLKNRLARWMASLNWRGLM